MSQSDPPPSPHEAEERHRRRVTIIAAISVAVLVGVLVWVVQMIVEQQRIERCIGSRRPDCFTIEAPPPERPVELQKRN